MVLISDMQVPFGDKTKRTEYSRQHEWIGAENDDSKWGVALVNAAISGKLAGVDTNCVSLMTAGDPKYYGLVAGVNVIDKTEDTVASCRAIMDKQSETGAGQGWSDDTLKRQRPSRGG